MLVTNHYIHFVRYSCVKTWHWKDVCPDPETLGRGQFRALSSHFSEGFISQGVIHRLIFDLLGGRAFD